MLTCLESTKQSRGRLCVSTHSSEGVEPASQCLHLFLVAHNKCKYFIVRIVDDSSIVSLEVLSISVYNSGHYKTTTTENIMFVSDEEIPYSVGCWGYHLYLSHHYRLWVDNENSLDESE